MVSVSGKTGDAMDQLIEVGALVRHPGEPAWGRGQVQSIIRSKATVNFEDAGKIVVDLDVVALEVVRGDWL